MRGKRKNRMICECKAGQKLKVSVEKRFVSENFYEQKNNDQQLKVCTVIDLSFSIFVRIMSIIAKSHTCVGSLHQISTIWTKNHRKMSGKVESVIEKMSLRVLQKSSNGGSDFGFIIKSKQLKIKM